MQTPGILASEARKGERGKGGGALLKVMASTSIAHFANDGYFLFIPMLIPLLMERSLINAVEAGLLGTLFNGVATAASPLVGLWAGRSRRVLLLMGLALAGYALSVLMLVPLEVLPPAVALAVLVVAVVLAGFASAFYHPIGATVLSHFAGQSRSGALLGINGSLGSLGRALYPSIMSFSVASFGMSGGLAVMGSLGLAMALSAAFFGLGIEDSWSSEGDGLGLRELRQRWKAMKVVVPIMLVAFLRTLFIQGIVYFNPSFLRLERGYSYTLVGVVSTVSLLVPVVGQPVLGWASDRYGRARLLAVANLGAALAVLAYLEVNSLGWIVAWLAVFSLFSFSAFPLLMSLTRATLPRNLLAMGNSLVWGVALSLGGAVGPMVGGLLVSVWGNSVAFIALSAVGVLSALPLLWLRPRPDNG
jgi:FSR family fosmidomycin resistance protein-like MFS transporter